jgi:hypothetical protein
MPWGWCGVQHGSRQAPLTEADGRLVVLLLRAGTRATAPGAGLVDGQDGLTPQLDGAGPTSVAEPPATQTELAYWSLQHPAPGTLVRTVPDPARTA